MTKRTSNKRHWDDFWVNSAQVSEVYDNDGRVSAHLSALTTLQGKKVLEVGAGTGRDGIFMADQGASVVSLDYSLPSLRLIAGQLGGKDRVELCCGDAFTLPFGDNTFDLVFHQGLLEHFRDPGRMLAEHHRVLRPGGYILVDVPQRYHYYTVLKHMFISMGKWFAGWETEFSPRELERLLERHSFSVVLTYGEWLNPPIWFRILRKGLLPAGIRLPMYPRIFTWMRKRFAGWRGRILRTRLGLNLALVVGTIARKEIEERLGEGTGA
ncbi:MAG: class I SAM-dependent methyltransferase [Candidatus Krumholzibacteriota bacterium]|nr:class I SAM-dependent methyltransferase [Candidatus Krumholzibacteriota bacterium]